MKEIKFGYSEKATKIGPSFTYDVMLLSNFKQIVEDGPNVYGLLTIYEL